MMAAGSLPLEVFPLNISVDITRRPGVGADAVDIVEVVLVLAVPYQRPYHEFGNPCRRNQQMSSTATWLSLTIAIQSRIVRGRYAEKVAGWLRLGWTMLGFT